MPEFHITSEEARTMLKVSRWRTVIVDEYIDEALNQEGEEYFTSMETRTELLLDFDQYAEIADAMAS